MVEERRDATSFDVVPGRWRVRWVVIEYIAVRGAGVGGRCARVGGRCARVGGRCAGVGGRCAGVGGRCAGVEGRRR